MMYIGVLADLPPIDKIIVTDTLDVATYYRVIKLADETTPIVSRAQLRVELVRDRHVIGDVPWEFARHAYAVTVVPLITGPWPDGHGSIEGIFIPNGVDPIRYIKGRAGAPITQRLVR